MWRYAGVSCISGSLILNIVEAHDPLCWYGLPFVNRGRITAPVTMDAMDLLGPPQEMLVLLAHQPGC